MSAKNWIISVFGKKDAKLALQCWQKTFNKHSLASKYVLKDLATYCNVYQTSHVQEDPTQTAFNEGARDVFLHILEMSNLSLDELLQGEQNER